MGHQMISRIVYDSLACESFASVLGDLILFSLQSFKVDKNNSHQVLANIRCKKRQGVFSANFVCLRLSSYAGVESVHMLELESVHNDTKT